MRDRYVSASLPVLFPSLALRNAEERVSAQEAGNPKPHGDAVPLFAFPKLVEAGRASRFRDASDR